jgi:hypothetical protein
MQRSLDRAASDRNDGIVETSAITDRVTSLARRDELRGRKVRAVKFLIKAMGQAHPRSAAPIATAARITGLRALHFPNMVRAQMLRSTIRRVEHALRIDPDDAELHYYLGAALLSLPRPRRASLIRACRHFSISAEKHRAKDPRPLIGLAESHFALRQQSAAADAIHAAREALEPSDPRTPVRQARLDALAAKVAA